MLRIQCKSEAMNACTVYYDYLFTPCPKPTIFMIMATGSFNYCTGGAFDLYNNYGFSGSWYNYKVGQLTSAPRVSIMLHYNVQ